MRPIVRKIILALLLLGLVAGGIYYYLQSKKPKLEEIYKQQEITQGDIAQSVSANGTLNPVTLVNVGTQVSGLVKRIYVDFNDQVKKDQVLLQLDDALLTAQIAQTEGNLRNAQAALELAQANEARTRKLYAQEYMSRQDLDTAVEALKSARAQVDTVRGQLRRDQTNLGYSVIRSPVSGVVINRAVDVGQTVASSFQTPTLIQIAQDLSKMQIDSSFAEADIGNIRVGQQVKFNVDAFPNRSFEGVVRQLRLNPTVTSNVVTYNVVVAVDNPEQILLPGMTAYVNIEVARHENVLRVPNAALRFRPKQDESQNGDTPRGNGQGRNGQGRKKSGKDNSASGKVYVIRDGKLTPVRVSVGISDGRYTEINSKGLKVNDLVIINENLPGNTTAAAPSGGMRFRMF